MFIVTDKRKSVYSDLTQNSRVEIASYHPATHKWILNLMSLSVSGKDTSISQRDTDCLETSNCSDNSSCVNEIWSFGEENYEILSNLVKLRERLKPYICQYMEITHKTGEPIMRPMFFTMQHSECMFP